MKKHFISFLCLVISTALFAKTFQKISDNKSLDDEKVRVEYRDKLEKIENDIDKESNDVKKQKKKEQLKRELNTKNKDGYTPLFYAVGSKDQGLVDKMLKYGADSNAYRDTDNQPILFYALQTCDNVYIIESLIENGANCNYLWNNNQYKNMTPLLYSCYYTKNSEIIKLILSKTVVFDQKGMRKLDYGGKYEEYTPFSFLATQFNNEYIPILDELIRQKVDINSKFSNFKFSSLTALQYLLYIDDVSTNDESGNSAVEYLIKNGADVDSSFSVGNEKFTALSCAVRKKNQFIFDLIFEKVSESAIDAESSFFDNSKQKEGSVLLVLLFDYDEDDDFYRNSITKLLAKGADANSILKVGEEKYTPLQIVCESALRDDSKKYLCEELLSRGANPNKFSSKIMNSKTYDFSPLHYVAQKNNSELYLLLKKYKADNKLKDSEDKTPIEYKSEFIKNTADKMEFSYDEGGDIKSFLYNYKGSWENYNDSYEITTTSNKYNMAQIAILHGDDATAIGLLNGKIAWNAVDRAGLNSLDYALDYDRDAVVNFLINQKREIGKSVYKVIDKALRDGNTQYLERFFEFCDFTNISITYGINGIAIDPIVYAAIIDKATTGNSRENVLSVLTSEENRVKITKSGLNSKITKDGKVPAMMTSNEKIIIDLIGYGASLDIKDNSGRNLKDYAFEKNQVHVMNYLRDNNIKIGDSLFSAIDNELNGHESYVSDFIRIEGLQNTSKLTKTIPDNNSYASYGLVVYTAKVNDTTALSQERIKILRKLIEAGLNINDTARGGEYNGYSALVFAVKQKNLEVARFLIENGANVNIQTKADKYSGRTVLFYALENKDFVTAKLILDKLDYKLTDIQLSNKEDKNSTLLMFIARYGDFDFVNSVLSSYLAVNKYSLEKTDSDGLTPFLYAAAYNTDYRVMKLFRMYGANVYAEDKEYNNAYYLAKLRNTSEEVLHRLEDYGVYEK